MVIINTTILGAYARLLGLPLSVLEKAYASLGLGGDLVAAQHAYEEVRVCEPVGNDGLGAAAPATGSSAPAVATILGHSKDFPATLKTGSWSNQAPVYSEHSAPCNLACPAGNDVVGFIQALKTEGIEKAAAVLARTQALPSVCGRVCPSFCMQNCNRAAFDGATGLGAMVPSGHVNSEWSVPARSAVAVANDVVRPMGRPAVAVRRLGVGETCQIIFSPKNCMTVHLKGACSGCPSATMTLKMGIEAYLKEYIPEVKEVVRV